MSTPEQLSDAMKQAAESYRQMTGSPNPYREVLFDLLQTINHVEEIVNQLVGRWNADFLKVAKPHAKNKSAQDFEDYSKALIVPTDALRLRGFKELAHRIFLHAVKVTDKHCTDNNIDLHRGALYAQLAITYLEQKQHELGLSWLVAAASEDVRFNRVPDVYGSHAMSDSGILGEWVKKLVQPVIPAGVMGTVNSWLGTTYGINEQMQMLRSLAGKGDLNLFAGIINFQDMEGRTDYVGQSIRFNCLRDLATLFEVLLKRIGRTHADPSVRQKYNNPRLMLSNMIYQMHYQSYPTKHPKADGIFWNSVQQQAGLLDAIDAGYSFVQDVANDIGAVWTYLNATTLYAMNVNIDAIAKRVLLTYRLRNMTSHGFTPADSGVVAHADDLRLWLLQAVFYLFFWAKMSGQAPL